jgi:hypothetical protein
MRITLAILGAAAWFTVLGFGQTDKTFYFTQPSSAADITAMVTMIHTVVDLQDIVPDPERQAITAHGPVDKLVAADWIFQQLDHSPAPGPTPEYKIPGPRGEEAMRVFRVSPGASNAELTSLTTAIRTVADLQRLFPYQSRQAIIGRGAPDKMAAADWLVRQLLPPDGQVPTADSVPCPAPVTDSKTPDAKSVIQVFRLDPKATNAELTAAVTAIRTTADLQRLFPFESGNAIIGSGDPDKIAVAGWLVHELNRPPDAGAVHQTTIPGLIDGVVRLFYVGRQIDVSPLAAEIHSTLGIQRVFPFGQPPAVVVRGRPDQMSTVEAMVAKFGASAR